MALKDFFHRKFANPFSILFESKLTPHARTFRTTLFQKFTDTLIIFSGTTHHYLMGNKTKAGILDWVTLQIPALITLIKIGAMEAIRKLPLWAQWTLGLPLLAIYVTTSILQLGFAFAKVVAGLAIALIALPFIGLVQGIMYYKTHDKWKEVEKLFSEKYLELLIEGDNKRTRLNQLHDITTHEEISKEVPVLLPKSEEDEIRKKTFKKILNGMLSLNKDNECIVVYKSKVKNSEIEIKELLKFNNSEEFKNSALFFFNVDNVAKKFENIDIVSTPIQN